ncbi:hypothetical protein BDBG_04726 [Blastomyces gilchristii SLH14081]|uniref:DUF7514 domain-containing protein n=1 Tax=Blastomyces gilchristii (strain SLH14081) TaxID=559298 RepID=A0A179UPP8_BLAGS|nr:uncharacterized protein BDBG_04726 [Blastomyces gilchristii SLH14081]EQL30821.1 hypothetical protein BDFG_06704 [Blastomyces dermatitidis ATCC 26199]OAT09179.1 hypothetical protein BDBG_04726 [Blastomyces gilchristii SLH14081]
MSSPHNPASNYWGCLIRADKSATPLFEQLCLGIAKLITELRQPSTEDLAPENLAAFYRLVGGNYDNIFLHTPHESLSFIYQSLGCFHTLQPTPDPFKPPSIPALRPHGFVRWQTIQLLLCPHEHMLFLQRAVKKFDIINPSGGCVFPKVIPRDSFPSKPDPEMVQWHETVSQKLEDEYNAEEQKASSRFSDRDSQGHKAGPKSLDGFAPDETPDYFSRRGSTSQRPSNYSRHTPPSEPNPPYNVRVHKRSVPEFTSPLSTEPELRHDDIDEHSAPIYSRVKPRSRPASRHRRSRRGRSLTPPPRHRQLPSESSSESEDSEEHVRQSRSPTSPEDDDNDADYDRLFASRNSHARCHSHDAAHSSRKRWSQSPTRRHLQREDAIPPEAFQAYDYYSRIPNSAEFRPYPDDPRRMSSVSHSPRRLKQLQPQPPAAPHPPALPSVKFREYIFDDDGRHANSAPPSPVNHHPHHHHQPLYTRTASSRTPATAHNSSLAYRQYVPRMDTEPSLPTRSLSGRRKASASASAGSRSGSSSERARALSIGGKPLAHLRIDQTMKPLTRRY